jgi:hypothetical protein
VYSHCNAIVDFDSLFRSVGLAPACDSEVFKRAAVAYHVCPLVAVFTNEQPLWMQPVLMRPWLKFANLTQLEARDPS